MQQVSIVYIEVDWQVEIILSEELIDGQQTIPTNLGLSLFIYSFIYLFIYLFILLFFFGGGGGINCLVY